VHLGESSLFPHCPDLHIVLERSQSFALLAFWYFIFGPSGDVCHMLAWKVVKGGCSLLVLVQNKIILEVSSIQIFMVVQITSNICVTALRLPNPCNSIHYK
jgi:hypothetical protein